MCPQPISLMRPYVPDIVKCCKVSPSAVHKFSMNGLFNVYAMHQGLNSNSFSLKKVCVLSSLAIVVFKNGLLSYG